MDVLSEGNAAALAGLIGGLALGLAARRGRFCTLGAMEDALYGQDFDRLRMWALALCVAIVSVFALMQSGAIAASDIAYLSNRWNPLGAIAGGVIFGYGMALAGNCGYGALARLGGGDLRSFMIVLVMGISAFMAMAGPTAVLRVWLFPVDGGLSLPPISIASGVAGGLNLSEGTVAFGLGAALFVWAMAGARFRADRWMMFWSVIVGLAIVSGWAATAWIARTGFDAPRVTSHTFSAPVGETLIYVMTSTGSTLKFGIGSVVGVVLGALIGSWSKGQFRWEACDDPRELGRHILGAFLMGFGAVTAQGCSIGQGLSAFSVLALSAPLTLAAIGLGAALGLRQLIRGYAPV